MVRKFTANCDFGGQKVPVTLYIGNPSIGNHPLNFQSKWLADKKGGRVPQGVMDSFSKISEISNKHRLPFEDVCTYVLDEVNSAETLASDAAQATALSSSAKPAAKKASNSDSDSNSNS